MLRMQNYLYSIPDYDEATGIDITLEPPDDGAESDVDDPSEDIVDIEDNVKIRLTYNLQIEILV